MVIFSYPIKQIGNKEKGENKMNKTEAFYEKNMIQICCCTMMCSDKISVEFRMCCI